LVIEFCGWRLAAFNQSFRRNGSVKVASYVVIGLLLTVDPAAGQTKEACRLFCAPQFLVEPTITVENLLRAPRVITARGEEKQVTRETVLEIILAMDLPTRVPRLGVTVEAIFPIRRVDNAVEAELEMNVDLMRTGGWVSSHVDVVDKFSPAERPTDRGAYTHKLNFEWDTAFAVFRRLREGHWLRSVELEASLDYVATGLPKRGDQFDGETLVTDSSPWSLSLVTVIPFTR
jgi:hypothetical protein